MFANVGGQRNKPVCEELTPRTRPTVFAILSEMAATRGNGCPRFGPIFAAQPRDGLTARRRCSTIRAVKPERSMRTKCFAFLAAAAAMWFAGCAADQGRTYKMHQTSGKMTRGSDVAYRAICTNIVAGSHAGIWTGPKYPEKERAMRDALQHNKEYPGHDARIEP